jgi:hydrogenase-4 component B
VSEPILLVLAFWPAFVLLLTIGTIFLRAAAVSVISTILTVIPLTLCAFAAIAELHSSSLTLPIGPPGLFVHLTLDALSAFFLVIVLISATALMTFQAIVPRPLPRTLPFRLATCTSGIVLTLLASDAVLLAIGLMLACGALAIDQQIRRRNIGVMLIPLVMLAAVALLTPSGFPPQFDAIRAAPVTMMNPTASALLSIGGVIGLIFIPISNNSWAKHGLAAGLILPTGLYLLLRLVVELPASGAADFWGILVMIAGCVIAVSYGWRAAANQDITAIGFSLSRCQAGLGIAGIGILIISRLADLPTPAGDALAAILLIATASIASVAIVLATHVVATSAGTHRLARLGGLIHLMPVSSAALCGGLLGTIVLPPSLGFAEVWLLLRAIVSAPRTGGLATEIVIAITAAAIALAGILATTACLRLVGVAVLGRPRSPQGAGAREIPHTGLYALLILGAAVIGIGLLPGGTLYLLADPVIRTLTGLQTVARAGPFGTGPGYLALPVGALIGFFAAAATLIRRKRKDVREAAVWNDGSVPPPNLPFGDPLAQVSGQGFLPLLPSLPWIHPLRTRRLPYWRPPRAQTGFWILLAAAASLLIFLALSGVTG